MEFIDILDRLDKKKYNFYEEPVACTLQDYEAAKAEIISKLGSISDVCSLFHTGEVGAPGISDLDIIVVLNSDFENSRFADYAKDNFSPKAQYLLYHSFLIFNKELFYNLHCRWVMQETSLIYGDDVEALTLSAEEERLSKLLRFLDYSFIKLPRFALLSIIFKNIPIRQMLTFLSSIRYSQKCLEEAMGIKGREHWGDFCIKVEALRTNWFLMDDERYETLIDYLIEGTSIAYEMLFELVEYMTRGYELKLFKQSNKNIIGEYADPKFYALFYSGITPREMLKLNIELCQQTGLNIMVLPSTFLKHMMRIASCRGCMSNYIRNNIKVYNSGINMEELFVPEEAKERYKYLNLHHEFLKKGKHSGKEGSFFSFGYSPRSSTTALAKGLVRNVQRKIKQHEYNKRLRGTTNTRETFAFK